MMKYNNEWIKEQYNNEKEFEFIFFWGHQSKSKDQVTKSCLSQWYEKAFEFKGVNYPTAEHWMMAEKARLFEDNEALQEIIKSSSPKEAKAIGRKVKGFNDSIWLSKRMSIVANGNYLKFRQNQDLWSFLDATGNKILVEASPYDRIWGVGMKSSNPKINNPNYWHGDNLLGYALMEVRDKLRSE